MLAVVETGGRVAVDIPERYLAGSVTGQRAGSVIDQGAGPLTIALADEAPGLGIAAVKLGGPAGVVLIGKEDGKLAGAVALYLLHRVGADEVVHRLRIGALLAIYLDAQPDLA